MSKEDSNKVAVVQEISLICSLRQERWSVLGEGSEFMLWWEEAMSISKFLTFGICP